MNQTRQLFPQVDFKEQTPQPQLEPPQPDSLYARAFLAREEPATDDFAANTSAHD